MKQEKKKLPRLEVSKMQRRPIGRVHLSANIKRALGSEGGKRQVHLKMFSRTSYGGHVAWSKGIPHFISFVK